MAGSSGDRSESHNPSHIDLDRSARFDQSRIEGGGSKARLRTAAFHCGGGQAQKAAVPSSAGAQPATAGGDWPASVGDPGSAGAAQPSESRLAGSSTAGCDGPPGGSGWSSGPGGDGAAGDDGRGQGQSSGGRARSRPAAGGDGWLPRGTRWGR